MEGSRRVPFLNLSPPEISNNGIELGDEFFGRENVGHVVYRYGGKNRIDVGKACNMVQFIGFDLSEFSSEFVVDKIIGLGSVSMSDNQRVAQMNCVGVDHGNWEHRLNMGLVNFRNISAETV